MQETLLAIHVKRHTWRQDAPVLPWVYAIARFKLIDAFRRRGRRIEIEIDEIAETFAEPEAETVSERDINRALDGLPPAQRSVVSCRVGRRPFHRRDGSEVRHQRDGGARVAASRAGRDCQAIRGGAVRHRAILAGMT